MNNRKVAAHIAVSAATYAIDKPYEYLIPEDLIDSVSPGMRVRISFGKGKRMCEGFILDVHELSGSAKSNLKQISEIIDDTPVLSGELLRLALWLRDQCFCTFFDVAHAMLPSGVWHKFDYEYLPKDLSLADKAVDAVLGIENGKEIADAIFSSNSPCKKQELDVLFGEANVKKAIAILSKKEYISSSEYIIKKVTDKTERIVRISISKEEIESYILRKKCKETVKEALDLLYNLKAITSKELRYFTGISQSQINTLNKNGIVTFEDIEVYRRPTLKKAAQKKDIVLNEKQYEVYSKLSSDLKNGASCSLLHGVTGSGKTLIYFKLIEDVIKNGKKAILLVPEISLTPQLLEQVYAYFGDKTAVMHSALSVGERYDEWKRIHRGEVDVVVGTRSAVFSPVSDLGIVILDEEQDDSYKSSSNPRYHARDAAKFRCVSSGAMLLLGSATPSIESMYSAESGKYKLYSLPDRFNKKPLPNVIISDLRKSLSRGNDCAIGKELYEELAINIQNKEQSILFLNRRGASKYAVCDDCGEVFECPNCSVPLVYHSKNSRLMCHHCGYSEKSVLECRACGGQIKFVGFGTQKVEDELSARFPGVEVIRMDLDTTSGKTSHEQLLAEFRDKGVPILLGTQMITKGLDFENVTLVGVLSADQALFNENYKASENAFSLITQVVGRSGRGEKVGRAVVQTHIPSSPLISAASKQDYNSFYNAEIAFRKSRDLPPFSDLFTLLVMAEREMDALNACMLLKEKILFSLQNEYSDIRARVLGPTPAVIVKVSNKFRYKLTVSMLNSKRARDLISRVIRDFMTDKSNKNLSIITDINSTDF